MSSDKTENYFYIDTGRVYADFARKWTDWKVSDRTFDVEKHGEDLRSRIPKLRLAEEPRWSRFKQTVSGKVRQSSNVGSVFEAYTSSKQNNIDGTNAPYHSVPGEMSLDPFQGICESSMVASDVANPFGPPVNGTRFSDELHPAFASKLGSLGITSNCHTDVQMGLGPVGQFNTYDCQYLLEHALEPLSNQAPNINRFTDYLMPMTDFSSCSPKRHSDVEYEADGSLVKTQHQAPAWDYEAEAARYAAGAMKQGVSEATGSILNQYEFAEDHILQNSENTANAFELNGDILSSPLYRRRQQNAV